MDEFASSLLDEVRRYQDQDDFLAAEITDLFFGGGTASLMPEVLRASAIETLLRITGQRAISEVTLECEPGTISRTKLATARSMGINRVCICAQSFDDQELRRLTRRHSSADSLRLLEDALSVGIENIHVDLMYGLPGQTIDDWRRTVEFTASLPIKHISAYKLYVFKHGALDRGKLLPRADVEDVERVGLLEEMYDLAHHTFEASGFRQYTLTEFARPGYECQYLLDTFSGSDILPLGPSAFGRCGNEVWHNSGFLGLYGNSVEWDVHRRAYSLDSNEAFKRDVILGLWLLKVDLEEVASHAHVTPSEELRTTVGQLCDAGLLRATGSTIWLDRGQRFGVGKAMKRFAELEARSWGDVDEGYTTGRPRLSAAPKSASLSHEVNAVLRAARRDPQLFQDILREPVKGLTEVGYELQTDEREALISVVSGLNSGSDSLHRSLVEAWHAVEGEHHRGGNRVGVHDGGSHA
jgi:oxygen-independent coproporphyrinogen-3 oxidase